MIMGTLPENIGKRSIVGIPTIERLHSKEEPLTDSGNNFFILNFAKKLH